MAVVFTISVDLILITALLVVMDLPLIMHLPVITDLDIKDVPVMALIMVPTTMDLMVLDMAVVTGVVETVGTAVFPSLKLLQPLQQKRNN
jgi:hypothetical protein